jgi:proton-dependent oligopeptide transporter, POT family
MPEAKYASTPPATKGMPPGIPFIIGNELAERFSFYGMKAILVVFMTQHLVNAAGEPDYMGDEQAKGVYHLFTAAAYFFPILGALLSDILWGKYKTILFISLMYCLGHGMLALMDLGPVLGETTDGAVGWDMKPFLYIGLALIAIGAGGIKPCVSAHVGDQFGPQNKGLLTQVFNWFYFSINVGAATSTLLTPIFLDQFGPWLAFGVPGVLMAIATFVFWLGRNRFVHVPPAGWQEFKKETLSPEGLRAMKNLAPLFLIFIPVFWSIFDQTGSAWVLQAQEMNREFAGVLWLESQIQAANPILILTLIPVFTYFVYPTVNKFVKVTPLRKIGFGLFLTAVAFASSAIIEMVIEARAAEATAALWTALNAAGVEGSGSLQAALRAANAAGWEAERVQPFLADMPNIGWQFGSYVLITAAEILVSIVSLEFAYTQAPNKMKSFIMGIYFLGVSLGNLFTSGVNFVLGALRDADGNTPLQGSNYYWAFTALALVTAIAFIFYSRTYTGHTFIQGDEGEDPELAAAQAEAQAPDAR